MLMNCTERTGRRGDELRRRKLLSLPSIPSPSCFSPHVPSSALQCRPLSVAIVTRGAAHFFFCSDLVRCSTCHSLPPRLTSGPPLFQSRAEPRLKSPSPALPSNPLLVFLLVSIVCVSSTLWQYLWYLTWSAGSAST